MKNTKKIKTNAGVLAVVILFMMTTVATTTAYPLPQFMGGIIPSQGGVIVPGPPNEGQGQPSDEGGGGPPPSYDITYDINIPPIPGLTVSESSQDEPDGGDGYFPPSEGRHSFLFLTGIYDIVDDTIRLVGLKFNSYMKADGTQHSAFWLGNVYMVMEGDNAGTYYYPTWFWKNWVTGTGGWFPGVSISFTWDPAHNRIAYFHLWADYTEDGQHIRYVDRTFQQNWDEN